VSTQHVMVSGGPSNVPPQTPKDPLIGDSATGAASRSASVTSRGVAQRLEVISARAAIQAASHSSASRASAAGSAGTTASASGA
jgi:hypothetical protein